MYTFEKQAAQGDLLITRVNALPEGFELAEKTEDGLFVVAHSETGHNHVMSQESADFYTSANDEFALYVVVNEPTVLEHKRSFDTHSPISVGPGVYRVNRQREYTAEGFRRAAD